MLFVCTGTVSRLVSCLCLCWISHLYCNCILPTVFTSGPIFIRHSSSRSMMFLRSSIRDFQFMPPNVLVRSSKRICVVSLFVLRLFLLKPLWLIWIFGMLLQLVVFQHLVCDLYCGWCKQVRSFLKLKAEWLIGDLMVDLEASKI